MKIEITKIEKGIKYSDKERTYFNSFRMYVSIDGKAYEIYGDAENAKSIVIEYFSKYMPHIKEECIEYIWTLVCFWCWSGFSVQKMSVF